MFFNKIIISLCVLLSLSLFAQEKPPAAKTQQKVFNVTEENYQYFLKKKNLVLFYFYSKYNEDSVKMKEVIKKIDIKGKPLILAVNIDTNGGLKKTFDVRDLPSMVILKKRKVIYGISGYIDDAKILSDFINNGLEANTYE